MVVQARILGCGSSGGVPRIGNVWGACDPHNVKNRRRRCSMLFSAFQERAKIPISTNIGSDVPATHVLIDTGADMREQLLSVGIKDLDAVFYTHEHADHVHGMDDLRVLAIQNSRRMDVYIHPDNKQAIVPRFDYCFTAPKNSLYPPILNLHEFDYFKEVSISGQGGGVDLYCFPQLHGSITSVGYRAKDFAYSSDLHDIPKQSYDMLSGLGIWVVDALRYKPHATHFNVEDALSWIDYFKPKRAILTNMHIDLDYETLKKELPSNVEPAYDGMVIDIE